MIVDKPLQALRDMGLLIEVSRRWVTDARKQDAFEGAETLIRLACEEIRYREMHGG